MTTTRTWLTTKRATGTSPVGVFLQLAGVAALLYGVHGIYAPASYILGGVGAVFIGEKL